MKTLRVWRRSRNEIGTFNALNILNGENLEFDNKMLRKDFSDAFFLKISEVLHKMI